jgi:hypothetical protein
MTTTPGGVVAAADGAKVVGDMKEETVREEVEGIPLTVIADGPLAVTVGLVALRIKNRMMKANT